MALAFLVNIPFVTVENLIYFLSERFFPKNREIGRLVGRPWEIAKNRETHGRTVRVGRSGNVTENIIEPIVFAVLFSFRWSHLLAGWFLDPDWAPSTTKSRPLTQRRNNNNKELCRAERRKWERVRGTGSDKNKAFDHEDRWTGKANQRYYYRYWRMRTAEGWEEEDENSNFVPNVWNVAFTRSCETN